MAQAQKKNQSGEVIAMGRKIKNALILLVTFIMTAVGVLPAMAASGNSLQALYVDGDTPIAGANFEMYRVGGRNGKGTFSTEGSFSGCDVTFNSEMDNSQWIEAARELLSYAEQNGIQPDCTGTTDSTGRLEVSDLATGLYLADGDSVRIGEFKYTPQPFWFEVTESVTSYAEPKFDRVTEPGFGNLKVSKQVTGNAASTEDVFSFAVSLSGTYTAEDKAVNAELINGKYGDMEFVNGVAKFTLKHGQSVTAAGLPAGIHYEVVETDAKGYSVSYEGATGLIPVNETALAVITNRKDTTPGPGGNTYPPASEKTEEKLPSVKTGDNSAIGLWLCLMLIGLATAWAARKYRDR